MRRAGLCRSKGRSQAVPGMGSGSRPRLVLGGRAAFATAGGRPDICKQFAGAFRRCFPLPLGSQTPHRSSLAPSRPRSGPALRCGAPSCPGGAAREPGGTLAGPGGGSPRLELTLGCTQLASPWK